MTLGRRCALVTGGASGIGKATVARPLRDGARVTIADADQAAVEKAVAELQLAGRLFGVAMDVSDWPQVERQTRAAAKQMGGLDTLVTSAGVTHPATAGAVDLAAHGVTVKAVSPGPIATPQTATRHSQSLRDKLTAKPRCTATARRRKSPT